MNLPTLNFGRHDGDFTDLSEIHDDEAIGICEENTWPSSMNWVEHRVENPPPERFAHTSAVLRDSLYIYGGYNCEDVLDDLWEFRIDHGTWDKIDATGELPGPLSGHAAYGRDNIMYVFGGFSGKSDSSELWSFDADIYQWKNIATKKNAPTPRQGASMGIVGYKLYVFGGNNPSKFFQDMHMYDTEKGTWTEVKTKGPKPSKRSRHSMSIYDTRLFVFGGFDGEEDLNDLFAFDTSINTWGRVDPRRTSVPPPPPRCRHAVCVHRNTFIVFGGYEKTQRLCDLHYFDIDNLEWNVPKVSGVYPVARSGHTATVYNNIMFIFGGWGGRSILNDLHSLTFVGT